MALKPTIYKFRIALTDMNRDYYDSFNLTIAQHPSENQERMMARVLAFCLNASADLQFTKGLSSIEEPDIWLKSLDDQIQMWIEVGEPDSDRIKKATRMAKQVQVYSFNTKSDVWWLQNQAKFAQLNASISRFDHQGIQAMTQMVARTLDLGVMLSGNTAYISSDDKQCEVNWETLQES
ncbi:YaeQ family protein [Vibrio gangliei]|uniref:YaeQ family protein n=1 Tax=Vibrio gangliei TaxID=2077090 RepID=UPI000D01980B|nr:YaeQ family protein [Vibrio gangliei]